MSRRDDALAKLRGLLTDGRFPQPGRLPPERRLAVELGISRSALREALEVLEAEGRVWRHVGRGTFVGGRTTRPAERLALIDDITSPAEVMEVRILLEPQIARMAALQATAADIDQMRHCLLKSEFVSDSRMFDRWDSTLHRALAEATHNTLLLAMFDALNAVRNQAAWRRLWEAVPTRECQADARHDHRSFVDAIARRDPDLAESLMRQHLLTVQRYMFGARRRVAFGGEPSLGRGEPTSGASTS